jgi:hypothetical protein
MDTVTENSDFKATIIAGYTQNDRGRLPAMEVSSQFVDFEGFNQYLIID